MLIYQITLKINLDETYKVKDFNYRNNGNIINASLENKNLIDITIFKEKINIFIFNKFRNKFKFFI